MKEEKSEVKINKISIILLVAMIATVLVMGVALVQIFVLK